MAIITISKGSFSGGEALAERLSETLEYRLLAREQLLTRTADAFGASRHQLESALIQKPGFLEGRGLRRLHYIHCVQATMARAAKDDNLVYHGEAGHLLLTGIPHHMRVRVVAAPEARIAAARAHADLTRDKAIAYIAVLDEKRDLWLRWVYGVDTNDPDTYDLVINFERIPPESATQLIVELVRRDFRTTPDSQKLMDDFALVSEIRAKIGLDPHVSDERIRVAADDGVVTLSAHVRVLHSMERVRELVGTIPGVKTVRTEEIHE